MKKIENFEDLNEAIRLVRSLDRNDWNESIIEKFPKRLLEMIDYSYNEPRRRFDIGVYPKNLSVNIFAELLLGELNKLVINYKTDNTSVDIIKKISCYSTRDESFIVDGSMSFDKGLLIMGNVGCGKTVILTALANVLRIFPFYSQYDSRAETMQTNFIPVYKLVEGFTSSGYDIFTEGLKTKNDSRTSLLRNLIFIDDIGAENIVSNYGNTVNVVGEFIIRRYDTKIKTFTTTNLDPKTLKSFYGDRVYSRMREMFNFIAVGGGDRRH